MNCAVPPKRICQCQGRSSAPESYVMQAGRHRGRSQSHQPDHCPDWPTILCEYQRPWLEPSLFTLSRVSSSHTVLPAKKSRSFPTPSTSTLQEKKPRDPGTVECAVAKLRFTLRNSENPVADLGGIKPHDHEQRRLRVRGSSSIFFRLLVRLRKLKLGIPAS